MNGKKQKFRHPIPITIYIDDYGLISNQKHARALSKDRENVERLECFYSRIELNYILPYNMYDSKVIQQRLNFNIFWKSLNAVSIEAALMRTEQDVM